MSIPAANYAPAASGAPAWRCSECGITNTTFSDPSKCSLCSHARCSFCPNIPVPTRESPKPIEFPPRDTPFSPRSDRASVSGSEQPASPPDISATIPESPEYDTPTWLPKGLIQIAEITSQAARIDVDRVTRDNPDVKVFRGYRGNTVAVVTPEIYYDAKQQFDAIPPQLRADFELHEEGPVYFGFKPEDLVAKGALFKKGILPNNLNNPIHEIFHIDHWTNTEDSIYAVLEPALRLASMFLQQPVAFQVSLH